MRKQLLRGLMIVMLILSLDESSGVVFAGPLEDGQAAYNRDDFGTALLLMRPLAEQGNASAQITLGSMYFSGRGIAQDYKEALKWYRMAADQGDANAQVILASIYINGASSLNGDIIPDYKEGLRWLRLAADQKNAEAQYELGAMYQWGEHVIQNYIEAAKWYRLSAAHGDGAAQFNLATMYAEGMGVGRDYVRAHMWFNIVAAHGVAEAAERRNTIEQRMTPQQVAEAQAMARKCEASGYKQCDRN